MTIWPFKPRNDFNEALSWKTDVFRAKSAEQRIALRVAPRREFTFSHTLTDYEYTAAMALIRQCQADGGFLVPDWSQAILLGDLPTGSAHGLSTDFSEYDFGDTALLWESLDNYEQVDFVDDSNETSISPVSADYTKAYLIPLWTAVCPGGLSSERIGANLNQCEIAFISTQNNDLGASDYSQYRSHDVLNYCPIIGSLQDKLTWPVSFFDNEVSSPELLRERAIPDYTFMMRWQTVTNSEIWSLRRWLHSRRGRQKAFWFSSYSEDFEPAASVSGTTLTVYAHPGVSGVGHTTAFDIEVKAKDGTSNYRRVTAATTGTPIGSRGTLDFTIDSSLTIDLSDIDRISFLRMARFDVDRIELSHQAATGTQVEVLCREIEEP